MTGKRAAKKTAAREITVTIPPEIEAETEPKTSGETAAEDTIAEVQDASPKQATATIWRLDADTGEKRWLAQVASEVISESWLARKYGGGKFRVLHRKPDANNRMTFGGQTSYEIDPSIRPEPGFEAAAATGPVMNADGSFAGGSRMDAIMETGIMGLLQQMQNNNQLTVSFVKQMTEQPKAPGFIELAAALAPFAPAIVDLLKARSAAPAAASPTELALKLIEAMKPAAAAASSTPANDLITMFERGMGLANKANGIEEPNVMGVVTEGLKAVGGIVNGYIEERRAARERETAPAATGPVLVHDGARVVGAIPPAAQTLAGVAPASVERPWIAKARPAFGLLLSASKWMTPEAAADTISHNLDDAEYEDLYNDLLDMTAPGFGGRLAAAFPAAQAVSGEWLGKLCQLLIDNFDEATDELGIGDEETAPASDAP